MARTRRLSADPMGVEAYIAKCPKETWVRLREVRSAINDAAPDAIETMSYFEMPGYRYDGYDYNGMFAWFGLQKTSVGLYLRPPAIQDHVKELAGYVTTKAIVRFPLEKEIPAPLVKRLVKASIKIMKDV